MVKTFFCWFVRYPYDQLSLTVKPQLNTMFTHAFYVLRSILRGFLGLPISQPTKESKIQFNEKNACVNEMCKRSFQLILPLFIIQLTICSTFLLGSSLIAWRRWHRIGCCNRSCWQTWIFRCCFRLGFLIEVFFPRVFIVKRLKIGPLIKAKNKMETKGGGGGQRSIFVQSFCHTSC